MDNHKTEVLNRRKASCLYALICLFALIFCGCTEIPPNCGNYVLKDTDGQCLPSTDPNRPKYTVTVEAGEGATGGGGYSEREIIAISAGTPREGYKFKNWTTQNGGVTFKDANSATTTFNMPAGAVTVIAVFEEISGPVTPPTDSTTPPITPVKYMATVSSEGAGSTGSGDYFAGDTVWISAGTAPSGKQFKNWTTTSVGVTFTSANSHTTTFIMPANTVTATANFETQTVAPTTYAVTIISAGTDAKGADNYAAGAAVAISAGTAPSGQQFKNWTTSSVGVNFVNENSSTTTFVMPANAVTVTANFEAKPATPKYTVTVSSVGIGSSGGGDYVAGAAVTISAGKAPDGQQFKEWTSNSNVVFVDEISDTTMFSMPANAVTVTANFVAKAVITQKYTVTVTGGKGGGSYAQGATVSITATVPSGKQFDKWTTSSSLVSFANASSAATTFTMPGNAVTVTANFVTTPTITTFTDSRDSKKYKMVKIGTQTWMAENSNYKTADGSWCYDDKDSYCSQYGRLYNWEAAMTACPNGWHLPSSQEWQTLVDYAGGDATAGSKLKSTSGWNDYSGINSNDQYGFSALPGGYRYSAGNFSNAHYYGRWWTATVDGSDDAYHRSMYYNYDYVYKGSNYWSVGFSARCVKN
jgi:uncharacterized protein (TIGR02145 family)